MLKSTIIEIGQNQIMGNFTGLKFIPIQVSHPYNLSKLSGKFRFEALYYVERYDEL